MGDIESLPFLEAIRQFRQEVGRDNALFIHLTLVPYIAAAGELKTKPTQHSVRDLMEIGIQPDILICRSEQPLAAEIKRKIALFCNVDFGCVIESPDVKSIYEIPVRFFEQGLDREVCQRLRLDTKEPDLQRWKAMTERILHPNDRVRIAVVGKYTDLRDAYKSVQEALIHGGIPSDAKVEIEWIASDQFTDQERPARCSAGYDGLLIPGGFGERGIGGMVEAIRWARENDLPFFGICLGLQVAIIEFARNVCRLPDTNSTEFEPNCETPVISLMHSQRDVSDLGGTMRLGAYTARLRPGSRVAQAYGADGDQRAPPAPLGGQQRLPRRAGGVRPAAVRPVARRRPGRGHRAARPCLVHRLPVPSRAEVAADPSPPAVRGVHRGGHAPPRRRSGACGR